MPSKKKKNEHNVAMMLTSPIMRLCDMRYEIWVQLRNGKQKEMKHYKTTWSDENQTNGIWAERKALVNFVWLIVMVTKLKILPYTK